ncbi:MAG: NAD(P)/FAD-dependent oxidoreductase [Chloroflexota bacterium]
MNQSTLKIGIVGAGPAGVVMAIALARRGIGCTLIERDPNPEIAPRFNPDRSYTIDITGHGLRALRYIDACDTFDQEMIQFKGIKAPISNQTEAWDEPGWTGSRGDILRTLMKEIKSKHAEQIQFIFGAKVMAVNVQSGAITYCRNSEIKKEVFDLIIGADGGGSAVRQALVEQIPEFTTQYNQIPNYMMMIELDQNIDQLDENYLYLFNLNPFCVAGAVKGDSTEQPFRWFCAVGSNYEQSYENMEAARQMFKNRAPRMLKMVSDASLASFAERECFHIGKMLSCSQLYGGRAVLLGDAAAPFSPTGQGTNAAMESAIVLDQHLSLDSLDSLYPSLVQYSKAWKPEADAATWICRKMEFGNMFHLVRLLVTSKLGISPVSNAKRLDLSYAQVKQQAKRFRLIWGK